jgi:hypothetical protein
MLDGAALPALTSIAFNVPLYFLALACVVVIASFIAGRRSASRRTFFPHFLIVTLLLDFLLAILMSVGLVLPLFTVTWTL